MPDRKINVPLVVSEQFLSDVLTTALEQGSGYWAVAEHVGRAHIEDRPWDRTYAHLDRLSIYSATLLDREDPEDSERWEVNLNTIIVGIELILSGKVGIRDDLHQQVERGVRENDADIDADASDCVLQAGIFGEVVYG